MTSAPTKTVRILSVISTILLLAGVVYLCLLSDRPLVAQGVYIDENGLLADHARPTLAHQDKHIISEIQSLISSCYTATAPLRGVDFELTEGDDGSAFASCLCSVARSLEFSCAMSEFEAGVLPITFRAPRTGGAESIVFTAPMYPHEFSGSTSPLTVLMAAVVAARRTGFVSRDVVIYVPIPTSLFTHPEHTRSLHIKNTQMRGAAPIDFASSSFPGLFSFPSTHAAPPDLRQSKATPHQFDYSSYRTGASFQDIVKAQYSDTRNPFPTLTVYQLWKQQQVEKLTRYFTLATSTWTSSIKSLPLISLALDLAPFVCLSQELSLASVYPQGNQANLDLASSLIYAARSIGITVYIHEPIGPLVSNIGQSRFNPPLWSSRDLAAVVHEATTSPLHSKGDEPMNLQTVASNSDLSLLHRALYWLEPHWVWLWNSAKVRRSQSRSGTLEPNAAGMFRYMSAQFNAQPNQFFHSPLGQAGIDSGTLSSIVDDSASEHEFILSTATLRYYATLRESHNDTGTQAYLDQFVAQITPRKGRFNVETHYGLVSAITQCPSLQDSFAVTNVLETWLRMHMGSHEKLHHSTWLYILGSMENFTTMSKFVPAFVLLWIAIPLFALASIYFSHNATAPTPSSSELASPADATSTPQKVSIRPVRGSPTPKILKELLGIAVAMLSTLLLSQLPMFLMSGLSTTTVFTVKYAFPLVPTSWLDFLFEFRFILILSLMLAFFAAFFVALLAYIKLMSHISNEILQSTSWFIVLSMVLPPIAIINFTYGIVLLCFTTPMLLFFNTFSPMAYIDTDQDQSSKPSTSTLISSVKRILRILTILVFFCPLTYIYLFHLVAQISPFELTSINRGQCVYNFADGFYSYPQAVFCWFTAWFQVNLDVIAIDSIWSAIWRHLEVFGFGLLMFFSQLLRSFQSFCEDPLHNLSSWNRFVQTINLTSYQIIFTAHFANAFWGLTKVLELLLVSFPFLGHLSLLFMPEVLKSVTFLSAPNAAAISTLFPAKYLATLTAHQSFFSSVAKSGNNLSEIASLSVFQRLSSEIITAFSTAKSFHSQLPTVDSQARYLAGFLGYVVTSSPLQVATSHLTSLFHRIVTSSSAAAFYFWAIYVTIFVLCITRK